MNRLGSFALSTAILAMASGARAEGPLPAVGPLPSVLQVLGSVTNSAKPVGNALVIALNLNSLDAIQTFSAMDGSFVLAPLPAAVYKIIAVKAGFAPAIAMIVPTKRDQRVSLRLDAEKRARGKDANQEIWELRGSLPADILRELDNVMETTPMASAASALNPPPLAAPRFRGQMMSLTGVTDGATNPAVSQTALGMESRVGDSWQIGFQGNLHRLDDPTDDHSFGEPLAQSRVAQLEVRSSPTNAYRVATTNSSWRYAPVTPGGGQQESADIRAHNFEWEHGDSHVQVRYLAQQNLFVATPGSELVEIAGNTTLIQTAKADVGVFIRVAQENVRNTANDTFRTADVTANASMEIVPSFVVHYGMASRMGLAGTALSPRTGAELKLGDDVSFIVSGQYKMVDAARRGVAVLPALVVWSDESRVLPRYSYSFGFVSGDEKRDRFSAIATVTAIDAPMRLVFTDGFEQFWDGLYVDAGDLRRDLRLTWRKQLGHSLSVDLESSAGMARPTAITLPAGDKTYFTGDIASTYGPTGTTLAVSYRHMRQPQTANAEYSSDRVNVRVAQALHLPFDLKLLLGYEVAHAQNSPFLLDAVDTAGSAKRYVGGLAVNF
jgi:hypothetical protein